MWTIRAAPRIRIIAVPPGEAPQWVREKWVGLELPLASRTAAARTGWTSGVLSGPRGLVSTIARLLSGRLERKTGFLVRVEPALAALEQAVPEAAAWWRSHVPHLMKPWKSFMFHEHVCHLIEDRETRA